MILGTCSACGIQCDEVFTFADGKTSKCCVKPLLTPDEVAERTFQAAAAL